MCSHYINSIIKCQPNQPSAVEANVQLRNKRRNATLPQMSAFGGKRANAAKNESLAKRHRLHLHPLCRFTGSFRQLPSKHHPWLLCCLRLLCRLRLRPSPKGPNRPSPTFRCYPKGPKGPTFRCYPKGPKGSKGPKGMKRRRNHWCKRPKKTFNPAQP